MLRENCLLEKAMPHIPYKALFVHRIEKLKKFFLAINGVKQAKRVRSEKNLNFFSKNP